MDFKLTVEGFRIERVLDVADLEAMLCCIRRTRRAVGFYFKTTNRHGHPILGVNMFLLTDDNPGQGFSFQAVDKKGNPATVENVKWSVSDPNLLALTVSADGQTASVTNGTGLGTGQLNMTCNGTGDLTDTLSGSLDIQVVAGAAASITITPVAAPPAGGGGGGQP